mmetsp:Transcript_38822/g.82851  ORF Transcript_38822/g.82851 Transcript_38822/m.82851 type:complete len:198 (-) Transcript_38822:3553-4146(-)
MLGLEIMVAATPTVEAAEETTMVVAAVQGKAVAAVVAEEAITIIIKAVATIMVVGVVATAEAVAGATTTTITAGITTAIIAMTRGIMATTREMSMKPMLRGTATIIIRTMALTITMAAASSGTIAMSGRDLISSRAIASSNKVMATEVAKLAVPLAGVRTEAKPRKEKIVQCCMFYVEVHICAYVILFRYFHIQVRC